MILYGVFVRYEPDHVIANSTQMEEASDEEKAKLTLYSTKANNLEVFYPMFQDVNIMVFVGFGFLMTFMCRYAVS